MQHLPTAEEQDWLIERLGALIRTRGLAPFVASPLVQPTPQFFPESRGTAAYVLDRSTRRLLQYAGLGHLDVSFATFVQDDDEEEAAEATGCGSVAAYFQGIEDGRCYFGLNQDNPAEAEHLAGVMCHEVAHAHRRHHGLEVDDEREEEFLTDLTTVYLGFGILAVNNSFRYRSSGEVVGSTTVTAWSFMRTGYLPPQALTYLLAVQLGIREPDRRRRQEVVRQLEPNQAAFLCTALGHVDREVESLRGRLGIPPRETWPSPLAADAILRALPPFVPGAGESAVEAPRAANAGRPVFRVRRTRAGLGALLLGGLGALIGFPAGNLLSHGDPMTAGLSYLLLTAFSAGVGTILGGRRSWDVCSDPECDTIQPAESITCPGCGGVIAGRIGSRNERLDAEERLEGRG